MPQESNKQNKPPIIILHGWGLRGDVYAPLVSLLKEANFNVYNPDLPGFGKEPLENLEKITDKKDKNYNLDDYVLFLDNFIKQNKITTPIIIGHSFGGRVAVKYVFRNPEKVKKLVLSGVPIIRHKTLKIRIGFLSAILFGRTFKILPNSIQDFFRKILYKSMGEWDYYKAGSLKQVFKNIIGEDLMQYAKEIKIPVLLIWGKDDKVVPVQDIEKIKQIMPGAKSFVIIGIGHKAPYMTYKEFFSALKSFI